MSKASELAALVRDRAGERCEYCLMHQSLQGATFHIEHIIPRVKGGRFERPNLALACPSCNFHKSDRISVIDPLDGASANLFHPRQQLWTEHFRFKGHQVEGLTPVGRGGHRYP